MSGTTGRWRLGFGLALLTTVLWGSLPVALKSLLGSLSPYSVTWFRYVASVLLLTSFLAASRRLPGWLRLAEVGPLLAVASLGFVGNNVFYLVGLGFVTPSAGQVVIQMAPLMLIGAGVWLFGESFSRWQALGVFVLLGGMLLFFHRSLGSIFSAGVLLILLAAALWTAYAVAQKRLLGRGFTSLTIMWVAFCTGFLVVAPLATPTEVGSLDGFGWILLAYCSINGLVGYGAFAEAMAHWEVSRVSAVLATTPVMTPLFAEAASRIWPARFTAEGLDRWQILGGALVAAGSIAAALARKPVSANSRSQG